MKVCACREMLFHIYVCPTFLLKESRVVSLIELLDILLWFSQVILSYFYAVYFAMVCQCDIIFAGVQMPPRQETIYILSLRYSVAKR